jgi:hypothetical protein
MHANKRPKHGGFVFDRHKFWQEMIKRPQQVDAPLFCGESNIFGELFSSSFWMNINLFKHIAES